MELYQIKRISKKYNRKDLLNYCFRTITEVQQKIEELENIEKNNSKCNDCEFYKQIIDVKDYKGMFTKIKGKELREIRALKNCNYKHFILYYNNDTSKRTIGCSSYDFYNDDVIFEIEPIEIVE